MFVERLRSSLRRLRWKLTLSYTAVTVGSLFVIILVLGYLVFSRTFIPVDIYNSQITPEDWIRLIVENDAPLWRKVLTQEPVDTDLIAAMLEYSNLTITSFDLLQVGDFRVQMGTAARGVALIADSKGILLGTTNRTFVAEGAIGQPLDMALLPGLEAPFKAALAGEVDPDQVFVIIEPNERFYFTAPIFDEAHQEVLGIAVVYLIHMPTSNDVPATVMRLVGQSVLVLLLAAGVVGTIFGALTARGMASRLEQVSQVTDSWSQGDFSEFIADPAGDEISHLAVRLNFMAEQLQQLLKRNQEMAVSEERNRLARDLHDSAKQEALAASFHLGTALTLFERDPVSARSHLVEAENLVDSVRGELTDLIHELRPISMNGARFDETLNEYLIEWAHQTGIEARLEVNCLTDLPLDAKQTIYRILQEALANVARHSAADKVTAALSCRDHAVEFCLSDDGVGFDPQVQHGGMGLDSMRERVEALKGDFSIQSEPGSGTEICLTIPIE